MGGITNKTVHLSFAVDWSKEVNPLLISPNKQHKASPQLLSYVFSLALQFGVDAEALSSMHFSKDLADLSEIEAGALIEIIKSDDVTYSAEEPLAECPW